VRKFASSASSARKTVVVVGGNGAFGQSIVSKFGSADWKTISFDLVENKKADLSIVGGGSWNEDVKDLLAKLADASSEKVDAVVCAAGGWAGGGVDDPEALVEGAEAMLFACYKTSLTAACVAGQSMREGGLLVLTGSAAATEPNAGAAGMLGYCMAKSATHYLTQTLAHAGLPKNSRSICVLPEVLDTPANREAMPDADTESWTKPDELADLVLEWAGACAAEGGVTSQGTTVPDSGALVLPTMDGGKVNGWTVSRSDGRS